MYDFPVPLTLQERVLAFARRHRLFQPGDRLGVAVSGGADSVALLRLLLELRTESGLVISVLHFHHQIRGAEADADENFVRALAGQFGLEFHAGFGNAPARAREQGLSLETAARELRYGLFRDLCAAGTVNRVATGHTLEDQAETVLLHLLRGAWTKGLGGIYPAVKLENREVGTCGMVVRPLLRAGRNELRDYLRSLGQPWCEDASNKDLRYTRNRIRHQLLPLLERDFNPGICTVLSEMAEIARAEESDWNERLGPAAASVIHRGTLPKVLYDKDGKPGDSFEIHLDIGELAKLPPAFRRRLVRHVAPAPLNFQHVEQVLEIAAGPSGTELELPWPWRLRRVARCPEENSRRTGPELVLFAGGHDTGSDYEYVLPVPGEVAVPQIGGILRACRVRLSELVEKDPAYNRQDLLSVRALDSHTPPGQGLELRVRNWRPGDRFWPAHSKSSKKVKEWLQARHLSGRERAMWPVAVSSAGEIVWLRGFSVPQAFAPEAQATEAVLLQVVAIGGAKAG